MVRSITLQDAEGSLSAEIPKSMADRLRLGAGDQVLLRETPEGILITPFPSASESDDAQAVLLAREAADRFRDALRELAR
jgi:antitoxin component of MazEF toxin-antitoxin module